MIPPGEGLRAQKIARFWLPLAATWMMMALEGPFLAALIARLAEPKFNLAAYGVALSLAMIVEAPIIMMLSAATTLVADPAAYRKLRAFLLRLNAGITLVILFLLLPPVFHFLARRVIGLPEEVAALTRRALLPFVPWPAAIGYRRFYQGILIRSGRTRAVAVGTVVRLAAMAACGSLLALFSKLPGAAVGGCALAAGVVAEAAASRFMARRVVAALLAGPESAAGRGLSKRDIRRFYLPLALTSILQLAIHPLVTFFLGRSRHAVESLAVLPVVNGLAFLFRAPGMALQEVVIALIGDAEAHYRALRAFAWRCGLLSLAAMALVAWTPLARLWFGSVSGLAPDLARFAVLPAGIAALLPLLESLVSLERGALVRSRRSAPVIAAAGVQVGTLFLLLSLLAAGLRWTGAVAAVCAHAGGYVAAVFFLHRVRRSAPPGAPLPTLPAEGNP